MFWRGVVATLLTAMLASSASSQTMDRDHDFAGARAQEQRECKPRLIAAGRTKSRPLTLAREIRGEGAAMAGAIANWQRDASAQHGSQWMLWERAEERSFVCGPTRSGSVFCTLEARPCGGGPDRSPNEETDQVGRSCN